MLDDDVDAGVLCAHCDSSIDPDDSVISNLGETLCPDCRYVCENCTWIGNPWDDNTCDVNGEVWCQSCTENHANWCERHEEYVTSGMYFIRDVHESWCDLCTENRASWCEDCDEYYADGCEECLNSRDIHDYNYRPDPIFRSVEGESTKLYFGIEIETEVGRNGRDISACSEYAAQILEHEHDLAYLKHDGSLNNGFEIVTHPASHAYYKQEDNPLWGVLETLRSQPYTMKSWDTGTCGLHIHISRAGFSGGAHQHRFLQLVYSNPEFYSTLAGREASHWAKFDDVVRSERAMDDGGYWHYKQWRSYKHKLQNHNNNCSDRYSAVNTLNRHTLEMRIFRGSINGKVVKAALDLAHASVEYTRELRVPDVWADALIAENFMEYIKMNVELYPELNERMNKLFTLTNAE
jgi:hypothetical protein